MLRAAGTEPAHFSTGPAEFYLLEVPEMYKITTGNKTYTATDADEAAAIFCHQLRACELPGHIPARGLLIRRLLATGHYWHAKDFRIDREAA